MAILKSEYSVKCFNRGELPCAEYVQQLHKAGNLIFERSKGTLKSDGDFKIPFEDLIIKLFPEAIESEDGYEIITGKHPDMGDCWVQILGGLQFRAYRK